MKPDDPDAPATPAPPPAEEPTLDRVIEEAIVRDIIAWRIEPGAWIRERAVAQRFGCSHGPVREAFRNLSREGFLEVVPWRGARVADLDVHSIADVFELWKCLFGTVCRLTAQRIGAEDRIELNRLMRQHEAVVAQSTSTHEHVRAAWPVGVFISSRCGSALAQMTLHRIARLARWYHKLLDDEEVARFQPALGQEGAALYRKAVDAIIAGDADAAETCARAYLAHTQTHIGRVLAARAAKRAPDKRKLRRT